MQIVSVERSMILFSLIQIMQLAFYNSSFVKEMQKNLDGGKDKKKASPFLKTFVKNKSIERKISKNELNE